MNVKTIAVIGAGTMGRGIIETAAVHGIDIYAVEVDQDQRQAATANIEKSIARGIKRGKVDLTSPEQALRRIHWRADINLCPADTQFVVEAVPEQQSLKTAIFEQLDRLCKPDVILASNTSSISISRLAQATGRPEKVVGMHFFNPVPIMQPVEIVRGSKTSDETIQATRALAGQLGKQPFVVEDRRGFVVNRVLMPLINEAVFALEEDIADAETIDSLMQLGCNHKMGPLALADLVGLDVCLSILQVLHRELDDPKFRPCPLLVQMVNAGQLGRKSGWGFYRY